MTYHYTECGLDNVYIQGLAPMIDDDGDEVIRITFILDLHRAIAEGIVGHPKGMSGRELRFLRGEMGMTQAELAGIVHVDKQTVGRWERGDTPLDSTAEVVVRRLAIEKLGLNLGLGIDALAARSVPSTEVQPINIDALPEGYALAA